MLSGVFIGGLERPACLLKSSGYIDGPPLPVQILSKCSWPSHVQELNRITKEHLYWQYILVTWVSSLGVLNPKMAMYVEQFMRLRDGIIFRPPYTLRHWMHSHRIPMDQF